MIYFFGNENQAVYGVQTSQELLPADFEKLSWLFGNQPLIEKSVLTDFFIGPRAAMVTPWSTNAVEITQNMGIKGVVRIEFFLKGAHEHFDPMLEEKYTQLDQDVFTTTALPAPICYVENISAYNQQEGLSLSNEEVEYLENLSKKIKRKLTDSEVFGFSQVNSEHCRHKIFNGVFVIDGREKPTSLFELIKRTAQANPQEIISAYKDNVAFIKGPTIEQFAPSAPDRPAQFTTKKIQAVLSLKAETHNFPTTVEPFNGAATGSGGEIRDRLAGGQGSLPLAGTAVYMTSYPRLEQNRKWEQRYPARKWLYQTPLDILIKASNGASDFGNKFGQPLITGSILTFEHEENGAFLGYDKVIMLAGGVGYGKLDQAKKHAPTMGDSIVVLGGDNYRIGMGGAAVSSADTGSFESGIELNAVQRSNPEMQKRVANVIRGLVESDCNPILSIHDHGAGGHLNCLSELVEEAGGNINIDQLPVGDPSLSAKEIIGNESQERMGLVIGKKDLQTLERIANRERAPFYEVGEITGNGKFVVASLKNEEKAIDFNLDDMFGSAPKTILSDSTLHKKYQTSKYFTADFSAYLDAVLQLESVACKDWLTNKVDRCVGGYVAKQQCAGPIQLPLNNVGVMALDYNGKEGVATAIGHAPLIALIDAAAGSRMAIAEALTNIIWAPIQNKLSGVALSANWMWACKNEGEDARLYEAVKGCSDFAIALGITIPTGKDSLSMTQKYADKNVIAPGTVIISAAAHCAAIKKVVEPVLQHTQDKIYYIDLSKSVYAIGGSAFAQILNCIGEQAPDITDAHYFKLVFNAIQDLIMSGEILAGHDISSGGLITTLLEMCFADTKLSAQINLSAIGESDSVKLLFAENSGIIIQATNKAAFELRNKGVKVIEIGHTVVSNSMVIKNGSDEFELDIPKLRDTWYRTSYLFDCKQSGTQKAKERFENYSKQPLNYIFPAQFTGKLPELPTRKPKAAIIREKGSNSEREMANAMHLAGFDVIDVHMTDLITGRETLEDIHFIGLVGGFSNSDVLGSAKGWAGAFLYNEKAKTSLVNFLKRPDTLSVGICNGCQLMMELEVINPDHAKHGKLKHNTSGKHESSFTSVTIQKNNSVMLSTLEGCTLGVWISHGEGRFEMPYEESEYNVVAKYAYTAYPANPNGSDFSMAMLCDKTGRHLVTMPHIERSTFPWNWAYYPNQEDEVSPWLEAFVNARHWISARL